MMPRSLSQTGPEKRRFTWPKGTPQIIALLLVLLAGAAGFAVTRAPGYAGKRHMSRGTRL